MVNWSNDTFIDCYNSISYRTSQPLDNQVLLSIKEDLNLVLNTPIKDEVSKQKLIDNKSLIEFSNGDKFKLNEQFVESAILLSNELDFNELDAAELLFYANDSNSNSNFISGISFIDQGRQTFFRRYEYILNILGYLITENSLESVVSDVNGLGDKIIQSFSKLYKILGNLDDLITKQTMTNNVQVSFLDTIKYTKSQLFNCHELLGQIMFNLVEKYPQNYRNFNYYNKIINHVATIDDNDLILLHYLPALLNIVTNLTDVSSSEMTQFHSQIVTKLSNDYKLITVNDDLIDLSASKLKNFEVLVTFIFLTNLIAWCKQGQNINKFHFNNDILNYIQMCSNYGVFENLLRFTNETANEKTIKKFEINDLCDFRSLIQINFPDLTHKKFQGSNDFDHSFLNTLQISSVFKQELIPYYWHVFFTNFVSHAAIVLTELRDSEEDYLLSSINKHQKTIKSRSNEDSKDEKTSLNGNFVNISNEPDSQLNYDDIYIRADLERFYLSFVYTYSERTTLCSLIWNDEEIKNELIGFINWGVMNNSSPLITATFCLLLSSLTCKQEVSSTTKIWEILINNNSSFKKTDYSKISMDSIIDSLYYYLNSLNENFENDLNNHFNQKQKRPDLLFSRSSGNDNVANNILIELSEDSTIFISGFILLISSLVENLQDDSERSVEIRQNLFNRFKPIIIGFLRFDNIMMNSQLGSKTSQAPTVLINESNRSTLINLVLNLLNSFVNSNTFNPRYEVWEIIDKWMNHQLLDESRSNQPQPKSLTPIGISMGPFSMPSAPVVGPSSGPFSSSANSNDKKLTKHSINIKSAFGINLVNSSNVMNFVSLIKILLTPPKSGLNGSKTQLNLLYPTNLGYGYRTNNQIGVWPYIEFLVGEIWSNSNQIKDSSTKVSLQSEIVSLLLDSLEEIDWRFLIDVLPNSATGEINYSKFFTGGLTFDLFIKLHHSIGVLNYLFDEKSYKMIFDVILKEEDEILVLQCLKLLRKLLDLQEVFGFAIKTVKGETQSLKPDQKDQSSAIKPASSMFSFRSNSTSLITTSNMSIYYPNNFNLVKFINTISYNIPLIIKLGLLVNSNNDTTVKLCLDLLKKINQKYFETKDDDNLLIKNKLLTLFVNDQETNQLKFSFINQFINGSIVIKQEILEFFIHDLIRSNGSACVTHFILGYDIKGNYLTLPEDNEEVFISNLIYYLMNGLDSMSVIDYNNGVNIIEANSTKLSSLILQTFIQLCSVPITSTITLASLRNYVVEENNLYERLIKYYIKIDAETVWNEVKFDGELINTANQFVEDDKSVLTFFNFCKLRGLIIKYLTIEFHSLSQSGSIYKKNHYLELLINGDKFLNESHKILSFLDLLNFKFNPFEKFNFQKYHNINLNLIYEEIRPKQPETGPKQPGSEIGICYDDFVINDDIIGKLATVEEFDNSQLFEVKSYLRRFLINDQLNNLQFDYLHSWVQLIEVIINDGNLSKDKNQNFILEILSSILPKINESFDQNTKFCEELISLCVILFDYYEDDNLFIERLISLFSTCYKGVINSNSTIELRNDLYIIMNIFLQKSFKTNGSKLLNKVIEILKEIDLRFLEIVCNDSIINEGSIRITSIILLESIIHLFNKFDNQFIINNLTKNNWLLLIIRSIKRIDEIFDDNVKDISFILYELINFKSVINLLIRVGQVRVGSSYLIQSELFSILKQLNFSNIDPDLGFNLKMNEISKLNLSINSNIDFVNYYEFLLPIFKLISILLISMGPNYKPSKIQGKNLMVHFGKLRDSIIKKDILVNENKVPYRFENELTELINQFILIDSLIKEN